MNERGCAPHEAKAPGGQTSRAPSDRRAARESVRDCERHCACHAAAWRPLSAATTSTSNGGHLTSGPQYAHQVRHTSAKQRAHVDALPERTRAGQREAEAGLQEARRRQRAGDREREGGRWGGQRLRGRGLGEDRARRRRWRTVAPTNATSTESAAQCAGSGPVVRSAPRGAREPRLGVRFGAHTLCAERRLWDWDHAAV